VRGKDIFPKPKIEKSESLRHSPFESHAYEVHAYKTCTLMKMARKRGMPIGCAPYKTRAHEMNHPGMGHSDMD
jgi:hypothetical protein